MPKTKEEVAKIARSAAIKKYKSYSVEKLDAEIERIKKKKTKSAKDMIDWSVLKGLKKRQTEKPHTLPTLSRKPYIKEYEKYSLEQVVKEQKRLSKMSSKRMPVNEIIARQDALKEVISNIPDAEFDKVEKQQPNKIMSYRTRAKRVFESHKRHFGKPHYARVDISGYGNANWDGYNLYEMGMLRAGDKIGTYQNEKDLKEWEDYGIAQAFTKYDPLELSRDAKGLKLK